MTDSVKIEVANNTMPDEWKSNFWIERGNNIYVFYSGELYDELGDPVKFKLDLKFTGSVVEPITRIKKIDDHVRPPVEFATPVNDYTLDQFEFTADEKPTIDIHLSDAQEVRPPLTLHFLSVSFVPDVNRDGMINKNDLGKTTSEKPFYFWINDDNDENPETELADIPGQNNDNGDLVINSERDLIDFFPVELRIKSMLEVLPPGEFKFKIAHSAGALNFVEMPNVEPDSQGDLGADSYLSNNTMANEAMGHTLKKSIGDGSELTEDYLEAAKNEKGVLLFESLKATQESFELIVFEGANKVGRISRAIPVEMDVVEKMFWRINLRPAADGQQSGAVEKPEIESYIESRKDQWFVFCHGYNVGLEAARGWNTEVFKRLHHRGSDAKFVGVTWNGNQGQIDASLLTGKVFTPDYWRNVYNAFATSQVLAIKINGLTDSSKSKTVIAAHSLGNMVVSSAISDYGLKAVQYFMFNSAVPREAYAASFVALDQANMRNPDWANYPTRLWASYWKDLYAANDGRNKLTWEGRFPNLLNSTTPFNYFSGGEDVAAGTVPGGKPSAITVALTGKGAWISQEMNKGLATKATINGFATGDWLAGGGWAFNLNHYTNYRPNPLVSPPPPSLPNTALITDDQLRANSFFKPFTPVKMVNGRVDPAADGTDLRSPGGSAHASQYLTRAWMLAHEIPALSLPVAGGALNNLIMGSDMQAEFRSGDWKGKEWHHSDIKAKDYGYVWKLYNDMCDKGNLRTPLF